MHMCVQAALYTCAGVEWGAKRNELLQHCLCFDAPTGLPTLSSHYSWVQFLLPGTYVPDPSLNLLADGGLVACDC